MPTCFVMQPFDGGPFDQRYTEVYANAIRDAGLDPYRVDQDPKVSIPIQEIESGIRQSQICLAEITLDNPNVWFELGYAIACKKEVVLICSDARVTKFPFDVQHRTIIKYKTGSPSDFDELKANITAKLKAFISKTETLANVTEISQLAAPNEGFAEHEVVALAAVAQNLYHEDDHAAMHQIHRDMEASGYTRVAATFAIKVLLNKSFLSSNTYQDSDGDQYYGYSLTEKGWGWVLTNQDRFALQKSRPARATPSTKTVKPSTGFEDMDDDIKF
jgi:hypothetical protein